MVAKPVTTSDLLALELKIGEEQRKIRHESNNKIQNDYTLIDKKISEYNTDLRLTNATMERMQEDITEIKDLLTDFMKTSHNIYATKEEHKANQKEIESIKDNHKKIIAWLIWVLWTAFVWFIWLVIKTLWIK